VEDDDESAEVNGKDELDEDDVEEDGDKSSSDAETSVEGVGPEK
jgi:hypothetical protein